jgi:hypothetical protein
MAEKVRWLAEQTPSNGILGRVPWLEFAPTMELSVNEFRWLAEQTPSNGVRLTIDDLPLNPLKGTST